MIPLSGRGGRGFDSLMSPIYFFGFFQSRAPGPRRPRTGLYKFESASRTAASRSPRSRWRGDEDTRVVNQFVSRANQINLNQKIIVLLVTSQRWALSLFLRLSLSLNPYRSAGAGAAPVVSSPSFAWAAAAPRGRRHHAEFPRERRRPETKPESQTPSASRTPSASPPSRPRPSTQPPRPPTPRLAPAREPGRRRRRRWGLVPPRVRSRARSLVWERRRRQRVGA